MKVAAAALLLALGFLAGVLSGAGRDDSARVGLPAEIRVRAAGRFRPGDGRPSSKPTSLQPSAPTQPDDDVDVDEVEHETEDLDDSGRGRGRGRGRGGDEDDSGDDDRSGSNSGSG